MTASPGWRLGEWTGRVLLLGAVAFWWGGVVAPQLISLGLPGLLPWSDVPPQLNPDAEESVANTVSAASLLIVALLAFGNALRSFGRLRTQDVSRRRDLRLFDRLGEPDWIAVGGWALLAVTAALLAWEEKVDFRGWLVPAAGRRLLGELWSHTAGIDGTLLMSPLIVAFAVAMWFLIRKGLSAWAVRALLILGFTAWLLAIVYDKGGYRIAFLEWYTLGVLLEETLEFSGTLLIGLGAGIALGSEAVSRPLSGALRGRRLFLLLVGSMAVVAVFAGFVVFVAALTFREPLVDTRGRVVFNVSLYDNQVEEHSLVQELGVLAAPVARLELRVTNRDPHGRPGILLWRVMEAGEGGSGPILREGRVEVAAGEHPRWENIDFPPLVEALSSSKGRPLAVQLVAEVERGAHLRIGGTKTNRLEHLQFWIQGMKTWPDQKLELVAYGPSELTLSKFQGIWRTFSWTWVVLACASIAGLSIITLIPALLVTAALPRRGLR